MPNPGVDMNSWPRSACYPRRTFYPLSDGPSMRNRRITRTCFRTCSTCRSHSQPGLYPCALRLISKQPEPSFVRLRYSLGGDRPSQTTHHAGSRTRFHGPRLDIRSKKGGISRAPPPDLAAWFQWLPPILHNLVLMPLQSYSKGSRGLSV